MFTELFDNKFIAHFFRGFSLSAGLLASNCLIDDIYLQQIIIKNIVTPSNQLTCAVLTQETFERCQALNVTLKIE